MTAAVTLPACISDKAVRAMNLAAAEFLAIHVKLDALEIPRKLDDVVLSPSERVSVLVGAYKSSCTRVAKGQ